MQRRNLVIFLYPENPAGTVLFINHIYYRNYVSDMTLIVFFFSLISFQYLDGH